MYSRRVHSAIGRSRPVGTEISRITDGVIESMRQLHISACRQEEEKPPSDRTQRSQEAAAEITSLPSSTPRGIDARTLAAQPPKFTITRELQDVRASPIYRGIAASRGGFVFASRGGSVPGQASRFVGRGRGTGGQGRGGARGRGRGGRGRGKGRRVRPKIETADLSEKVYSPQEWKFECALKYGVVTPSVVGLTTKEDLLQYAPCTPVSATGLISTVKDRMDTVAGGRKLETADLLEQRRRQGKLVSFRNSADREEVLAPKSKGGLYGESRKNFQPVDYEEGKNDIMRQLVAGDYDAVEPRLLNTRVGLVQNYGLRNPSYLKGNADALTAKVRSLLPEDEQMAPPIVRV